MVSIKAIELIAHAIEKSKDSYDKIATATNISKATLSRVVKQHTASRYTLDVLAAYFEIGEKYQELVGGSDHSCAFAAELTEELRNTRAYYEEKAVSVRSHYEEQIASLREQCERQEMERTRERETQQRTYDNSVNYLKSEIERLRKERDDARRECESLKESSASELSKAQKTASDVTGKKHFVFRVMAIMCVVMGIATSLLIFLLIVAFKTDAII